jgi:hydroxymethylpyrimidine pyrophosphatase-like HAD family hydrolase
VNRWAVVSDTVGAAPVSVKLLAVDLDGTVIRPDMSVARRTRRAVAAARRRGVAVVVATGRRPGSAWRYARELASGGPIVASDGAVLLDAAGGVLSVAPLAADAARTVIRACETLDMGVAVHTVRHVYWSRPRSVAPFVRLMVKRGVLRRPNGIRHVLWDLFPPVRPWSALDPGAEPVVKLVPVGPRDASERLRRELVGLPVRCTAPAGAPYEIVAEGVSKGAGLARLADMLGLDAAHAAAVGDGYNDVELFCTVGVAVAMANAPMPVRAAAGYLTETAAQDGAARAIERILAGEPPGKPVKAPLAGATRGGDETWT